VGTMPQGRIAGPQTITGRQKSELEILVRNARETMGALFGADPKDVSHEDCAAIFEKAYK